jgi:DNA-binding CsgD family transcriptional regulator
MFVLVTNESSKPDPAEAATPVRRDRSVAARRAARLKKAGREQRIVSLLNRGVSVAEIAAREDLSLSRMRRLVQGILAKRLPQPPAEFLALQVSRLNEALLLSYSAMHNSETGTNFDAVDRVVKIVRELDRYHGFSLPQTPRPEAVPLRLPAPTQNPIALAAPIAGLCGNGAVND